MEAKPAYFGDALRAVGLCSICRRCPSNGGELGHMLENGEFPHVPAVHQDVPEGQGASWVKT